MAQSDSLDLNGKLLIAMPGMGDPRFDKSVIFMCSHSAEGAMGLIINKPADDLKFSDILKQLDIPRATRDRDLGVHIGGPVETGRGFVLHSDDYEEGETTLAVPGGFAMTATLDILHDISEGTGPDACLLAMGYSGWGPLQLEDEIARNGWLIGEASSEIIFQAKDGRKWQAALELMGINPLLLSAEGGRA